MATYPKNSCLETEAVSIILFDVVIVQHITVNSDRCLLKVHNWWTGELKPEPFFRESTPLATSLHEPYIVIVFVCMKPKCICVFDAALLARSLLEKAI